MSDSPISKEQAIWATEKLDKAIQQIIESIGKDEYAKYCCIAYSFECPEGQLAGIKGSSDSFTELVGALSTQIIDMLIKNHPDLPPQAHAVGFMTQLMADTLETYTGKSSPIPPHEA